VDGEDAEDGLLHRPLAPVVAMDELVVLEPVRQRLVPDELTLALLLLLLVLGAIPSYAGGSGRRRSHGFLFQALPGDASPAPLGGRLGRCSSGPGLSCTHARPHQQQCGCVAGQDKKPCIREASCYAGWQWWLACVRVQR
jgi:hypothetical protein